MAMTLVVDSMWFVYVLIRMKYLTAFDSDRVDFVLSLVCLFVC